MYKIIIFLFAFLSISPLYALTYFDTEFIQASRALEPEYPELFKGFIGTDFEALDDMMRQKFNPKKGDITVVPALSEALMKRIALHQDDPHQKVLYDEFRAKAAQGQVDYAFYLMAMFRHQALLKKREGQSCDFEDIALEVSPRFHKTDAYYTFGSAYFQELQEEIPFASRERACKILKYTDNFYPKDIENWGEKDDIPILHFIFPLFDHHEMGVAYLAYMFWNHVYPVAFPTAKSDQPLHEMQMSIYGELVHDFIHFTFARQMPGPIDYAANFMRGQEHALDIVFKRGEVMRKTLNQVIKKATLRFHEITPMNYKLLMIGLFVSFHEDYLTLDFHWRANTCSEFLIGVFNLNSPASQEIIKYINEGKIEDDGKKQDDVLPYIFSNFAASPKTGISPLSDSEIIEKAARIKGRTPCEGQTCEVDFCYVPGGEVIRARHFTAVVLKNCQGNPFYVLEPNPNFAWKLMATNVSNLVNLGSVGINEPHMLPPDLSQLQEEKHVRRAVYFYSRDLQVNVVKIALSAFELARAILDDDEIAGFEADMKGCDIKAK